MIKDSPTAPNADFLCGGQQEVLQDAIDKGDISIVAEAYTDGWLPANAQRNMAQILTAQDNQVDAVATSNDGITLWARFLAPVPITRDNLDVVVDVGWLCPQSTSEASTRPR